MVKVSKLEELGVETAILSFDRQKSGLEVYEVSSKGAADFLDSTDTANNFALHFKGDTVFMKNYTNGLCRYKDAKIRNTILLDK